MGRRTRWTPGNELKFAVEDVLVKEEQRTEGLVLGGGGDVAVKVEMGEKGGDFFFAHLVGMAFAVEEDEAANPIEVSVFCADAVTFDAKMPADAVEKCGRRS